MEGGSNVIFIQQFIVWFSIWVVIGKFWAKVTSKKSLTIKLQYREKNIELSKYLWELKEREILIVLLIGSLLWNCRNMFVNLKSMIYAFVRSSLLQEQILMFCPVNVMSLTENAGIKINLLWSANMLVFLF